MSIKQLKMAKEVLEKEIENLIQQFEIDSDVYVKRLNFVEPIKGDQKIGVEVEIALYRDRVSI